MRRPNLPAYSLPTNPMKIRKNSAFTLIELLVVISIIAIIASLAMPAFAAIMNGARQKEQMNNGRQIAFAMRNYASETSHGGLYPAYKDVEDANTLVNDTNEAFEILTPRYLEDKKVYVNKQSEWSKKPVQKDAATANKVLPGECDWVYVRGLSDTSNSKWPLLANAFEPGTTHYTTDVAKKGGVWKGVNAVVVWKEGNAEIVETNDKYEVKRPDRPSSNAFEPADDWLSGDTVKVLYPKN